jgi:hypothetical protein
VSLGAGEKKRRMGIDHEGNALVRASIVGAAMACDIAVNYPMCCPRYWPLEIASRSAMTAFLVCCALMCAWTLFGLLRGAHAACMFRQFVAMRTGA